MAIPGPRLARELNLGRRRTRLTTTRPAKPNRPGGSADEHHRCDPPPGGSLGMRAEMSRSPREAPAPRMEALARLPIFLQLESKRAVLVGDGAGAAWKAELLSAAGAHVDVYVETPPEELFALAAQARRGPIRVHARKFAAADLEGAALAVGALDAHEEAAALAA